MKTPGEVSILHLPLASTGISETFIKAGELNGYHTLEDILAIPLPELIKKEWITKEMWLELTNLISQIPLTRENSR